MKTGMMEIETRATGRASGGFTIAITFDNQATKLLGPNGGHYLPCEKCHRVFEVDQTVVVFYCSACDEHDGAFDIID